MLLTRLPLSIATSFDLHVLGVPPAYVLHQSFLHCAIFPTAAARRSLGRVSVPMWLIILSDQLLIKVLVGRYPTNKLIKCRLILRRIKLSP